MRPQLALAAALCASLVACRGSHAGAPGALPKGRPAFDLVFARASGEDRRTLWVVPAGSGSERQLTDSSQADGLPRYTRDGRAVIFSSNRSGNWQLWQIPVAGGVPERLRTNSWTEWQADLSPDGKRLAFLSDRGGAQSLWLEDLASGGERLLVRHGKRSVLGNPHWDPAARRIVFSSNYSVGHQIFLVDVENGEQKRLSGLLSGGCEPRFSPDGRKVVHVTRGHHRPTSQLIETDIVSGSERILVEWPALNYDPVYSPDGRELAFASNVSGRYQVYCLRLADGKAWQVTSGPGDARDPDYRPPSAQRAVEH